MASNRKIVALLSFFLACCWAQPEIQLPPFENGANCLFIGHNFFIPVAVLFGRIASRSNGFTLHDTDYIVASGGDDGSPRAIWDNPNDRAKITLKLSTGQIELFGMTISNGGREDYQNWIDLALSYNPETRFFIGSPWAPNGPVSTTEGHAARIQDTGERVFAVVKQLRATYPETTIFYLNYGKVASQMRLMFDAGKLPDVDQIPGPGARSFYADNSIGLGGTMLLELSALMWMGTLYGAPYQELRFSDYNKTSVKEIMEAVSVFTEKHNTNETDYEIDANSNFFLGLISTVLFCF